MAIFSGGEKLLNEFKDKGLITPDNLANLSHQNFNRPVDLLHFLVDQNLVKEEDLFAALAESANFSYLDLRGQKISREILELVPFTVANNYQLTAINQEGNIIKVGLIDPYNFRSIEAIDFLAKQHNLKVKYVIISFTSLADALEQYTSLAREVSQALKEAEEEKDVKKKKKETKEEDVEAIISVAPVSKIVSVIIRHAVDGGASDIHIEPLSEGSRVRYRIDGVLRTSIKLPAYVHSPVISRIKVLANLKIDETRVPQDGRIGLDIEGRKVDFRVSIMPLLDKEKVVLRILDTGDKVATLAELGYSEEDIKTVDKNIRRPHGLLLISGPTGSGKSTTLYSILNTLDRESNNIVTLEDPVEFYIEGVNQSQIKPEVHFTFASGLRAILRQDPNIIMVGEVRDKQTAEMAIHAGLTGHLIFSTIHTNDSLGVVPRLIDMGVEPFLLASTLNLVIAQRLVRKVCSDCRQPTEIPEYLMKIIKKELQTLPVEFLPSGVDANNLIFYKGAGCQYCGNTGYQGRKAIAEILKVTDELKQLIVSGYNFAEVKKEMQRQKMMTLLQNGLVSALAGLTTVEEVLRVTQE
ncbi:MAG: GspE/PulE family protein [Patescibacteria group bacterium]